MAIEKLKRKIENKKRIKIGLMQELLEGKLRLKSFNSRWDTVDVGSLGSNYAGLTGKMEKISAVGNHIYLI